VVKTEIILLWITVGLYALSTCFYVYSIAFQKEKYLKRATIIAGLGLVIHTVALGLRWVQAGHGPYMRRYEVYSSNVWIAIAMFLIAQYFRPSIRVLGSILMPVSFLLIGMAVMASPEIRTLPSTFKTYWLIVHILFAKLSYGSALIGTGLGVLYLIKEKKKEDDNLTEFYKRMPKLEVLDELSYAFIGFGFLLLGIMIIAGSIWAKSAWGSYWGWDPVETWSLISWFVYGLYLHLRRTYGWKGKKAAWLAIGALGFLIFALFGVGLFYDSIHSPYINGST